MLMKTTSTVTMTNSSSSATPTPGSTSSNNSAILETLQEQQQLQQQLQLLHTTNTTTKFSRPLSRAPSVLDSPTLARVERARLRLEQQDCDRERSSQRSTHGGECVGRGIGTGRKATTFSREESLDCSMLNPKQSLLMGRITVASMTGPIKRGLLWQQRDRIFSRWKERYFVLTRDYLHCFKRASGSANERASDMGQFIFKIKLVDVEKVEWLNRRSYSAIGVLLGREGRVLLRCDDGLEDWFELLEECTLTSKERRRTLKVAQGPRSRASLAAPVSHSSLQFQHYELGNTYSSALDDWLMTNSAGGSGVGLSRHKIGAGSLSGYAGANPFLFSDSVPDLSALHNENHDNHLSGITTNHSTPQKMHHHCNLNLTRYSNGYASAQNSFTQVGGALYGSPRRISINNNTGSNRVFDEEAAEESEVQLRRPRLFRGVSAQPGNANELDRDWLYRKPRAPTDIRHSVQSMLPTHNSIASLANTQDCSAHDSGLDSSLSTHRPCSYREATNNASTKANDNMSLGIQLINSPSGNFQNKKLSAQVDNLNLLNALQGPRFSVQNQRILKMRNNDEESCTSIRTANRLYENFHKNPSDYDTNQNQHYYNGNATPPTLLTPQHTPQHKNIMQNSNGNENGSLNRNRSCGMNGSALFRERHQHPALAAIINEEQGLTFREETENIW